jgi:hypothetical protein
MKGGSVTGELGNEAGGSVVAPKQKRKGSPKRRIPISVLMTSRMNSSVFMSSLRRRRLALETSKRVAEKLTLYIGSLLTFLHEQVGVSDDGDNRFVVVLQCEIELQRDLRHVVEVVLEQVVSDNTKLRPANGIVRSAVAFLDYLVDKLGYFPTRRGAQKAEKKLEYEPEFAVFLGTRGPEVRFAIRVPPSVCGGQL